ncbi:hypothetical protein O7628_13615 [Micromonospora sp. WMMD956]|uniref:hypothetical protein n=1 Tax=Micromonospora sp. WMMD956 TaxID=3016108 RepID=UPI002417A991|nr:hypothetical protein [Micromonospora sp. WMMD956]MDG4816535.1 hypothetical protein [Micromonospora sp. WMMD956]
MPSGTGCHAGAHTMTEPGTSAAAAGLLLRHLLTEEARYRRLWQAHVRAGGPDQISTAAVAKVLSLHLWEAGERSEQDRALPRTIRDRVRRALSGEVISAETMQWFVDAFEMTDVHADRLWGALRAGGLPLDAGIVRTLGGHRHETLPLPQLHRTLSVFERHLIGPAGVPVEHHAVHVIAALRDGVDRYAHVTRDSAVEVEVLAGGEVGESYPYGDGLQVVEVLLNRTLNTGDIANLEYRTVLPTDASPEHAEVRRIAHGRTERVHLRIDFDRSRVPPTVWWVAWNSVEGGDEVLCEPMELDERNSAQRFVTYLEEAAVGYRWAW